MQTIDMIKETKGRSSGQTPFSIIIKKLAVLGNMRNFKEQVKKYSVTKNCSYLSLFE